jgi:DNA-binding PadR family transcriptional regulator
MERSKFGRGNRAGRFFKRGDVKYALLELLQERPMHGYEMMKALEEISCGFYIASAGAIYPALQILEHQALITVTQGKGSKKIYHITDVGNTYLAENKRQKAASTSSSSARGMYSLQPTSELQALQAEVLEVAHLVTIASRMVFNNPEQMAHLYALLVRVHKDLSSIVDDRT